jgi:DNA modification methylase
VIWCNTDYEADALKKAIPEAIEVRGSQPSDKKEQGLEAFSTGEARIIITKPSIAGYGMNWQHCHKSVFVGLSYSFEQFYQALRRFYRFGQENIVEAHVIYAEGEHDIIQNIQRKQREHEKMKTAMNGAMKNSGLVKGKDYSLQSKREAKCESGEDWKIYLGDCCELVHDVENNSVGLSVFSPPFANLYIYSDSEADMGNCQDDSEFFEHFKYLIPEIKRITIPGRLCAVHCKDLPKYKNRDGASGLDAFPDKIREAFEDCGWQYHSRITIWKDPVIEMQRTKSHGLLYKENCKNSCSSRQGMADYMLIFRKWDGIEEGEGFPHPVTSGDERYEGYVGMEPPDAGYVADTLKIPAPHKTKSGKWPSSNPFPEGSEAYRLWSILVWQKYASPVWMDINQMNVLNYKAGRNTDDERHICPLQLDVIARCIHLWSNYGDTIFSPFTGIGSECHEAIRMGRKFVGFELKPEYLTVAARNIRELETKKSQLSIFDVDNPLPDEQSGHLDENTEVC